MRKHNQSLRILNKTKNRILATKAILADSFFTRAKGLLGKKEILAEEALVITRCQSIHMFFMKFAIDAVFVSKENKVVGIVENIKPNQLSPIFFKSSYVVELIPGKVKETNTSVGDVIEID